MRKKTHVQRKSLLHEALETRQVFSYEFIAPTMPNPMDVGRPIEERLAEYASYMYGNNWSGEAPLAFTPTTSRSGLDEKLATLATHYWKDVLGKPVADFKKMTPFWNFVTFDSVNAFRTSDNLVMPSASSAVPLSTGSTNVQVAGIDEADTLDITPDGFIYVATADGVSVVDARDPADLKAFNIPETKSSDGSSLGVSGRLFVFGDRLIKLRGVNALTSIYDTSVHRYSVETIVEVYDISQRTNPSLVGGLKIEGNNLAARLQDGRLMLVQLNEHPILPMPLVETGTEGVQKFESAQQYVTRNREALVSTLIPDYQTIPVGQTTPRSQDIGSWDDVAVASDFSYERTTVLNINVTGSVPELVDSEIILGSGYPQVYDSGSSLVLFTPQAKGTDLFRVTIDAEDQLHVSDKVTLPAMIRESRWLSEKDGVLRVAANTLPTPNPAAFEALPSIASIYTIGDTDDGWQVIGKLLDFAPSQEMYSAQFDGDMAVVSTGYLDRRLLKGLDPLHGIDLSDPANPRELSELTIPGFNVYLHQIDATHWLGVGFDLTEVDGRSTFPFQVTLYEGKDLSNPTIVDRWSDGSMAANPWNGFDPLSITYDADSGLLTLGSQFLNLLPDAKGRFQLPIFKIDVSAKDTVQRLNTIAYPERVARSLIHNGHLFSISDNAVIAQSVDHLDSEVDRLYLPIARPYSESVFLTLPAGADRTMTLKGFGTDYFQIISLEGGGISTRATFDADNLIKVHAIASDYSSYEQFTARIRYYDGQEAQITVNVNVTGRFGWQITPIDWQPSITSDSKAQILAHLETDQGEEVGVFKAGDEAILVISVKDLRDQPQGVFSAHFDVSFDSENIEVIGEPEFHSDFGAARSFAKSANGFRDLGAIGNVNLSGQAEQEVVRIRLRITDDRPVAIHVDPSRTWIANFRLVGEDLMLRPENVQSAIIGGMLNNVIRIEGESKIDVNSDGYVSGLDVLQIVNFINGRFEAAARALPAAVAGEDVELIWSYDLTGDGDVTGLDVLQIINVINSGGSFANGEGESQANVQFVQVVDLALYDLNLKSKRL